MKNLPPLATDFFQTGITRTEFDMLTSWFEPVTQTFLRLPGGTTVQDLTIASGVLAPTYFMNNILCETGTEDDLELLDLTDYDDGQILCITLKTSTDIITIKHNATAVAGVTAPFITNSGADIILGGVNKKSFITFLIKDDQAVEVYNNTNHIADNLQTTEEDLTKVLKPNGLGGVTWGDGGSGGGAGFSGVVGNVQPEFNQSYGMAPLANTFLFDNKTYIVSATNVYSTYDAYMAFGSTGYIVNGTAGSFKIQFPYAQKHRKLSWKSTSVTGSVKHVIIRASNDGTTWTDLYEEDNMVWSASERKYFEFPNDTAYTHYEVDIIENNGAIRTGLSGLIFPGYALVKITNTSCTSGDGIQTIEVPRTNLDLRETSSWQDGVLPTLTSSDPVAIIARKTNDVVADIQKDFTGTVIDNGDTTFSLVRTAGAYDLTAADVGKCIEIPNLKRFVIESVSSVTEAILTLQYEFENEYPFIMEKVYIHDGRRIATVLPSTIAYKYGLQLFTSHENQGTLQYTLNGALSVAYQTTAAVATYDATSGWLNKGFEKYFKALCISDVTGAAQQTVGISRNPDATTLSTADTLFVSQGSTQSLNYTQWSALFKSNTDILWVELEGTGSSIVTIIGFTDPRL